jgi:hypothetical protein
MDQVLFLHTEAELIRAAIAGDGSAFAEAIRPHYQAAFRVAYGLLHDVDEAGAYERLRIALAKSPARPQRPAFQMRWSIALNG